MALRQAEIGPAPDLRPAEIGPAMPSGRRDIKLSNAPDLARILGEATAKAQAEQGTMAGVVLPTGRFLRDTTREMAQGTAESVSRGAAYPITRLGLDGLIPGGREMTRNIIGEPSVLDFLGLLGTVVPVTAAAHATSAGRALQGIVEARYGPRGAERIAQAVSPGAKASAERAGEASLGRLLRAEEAAATTRAPSRVLRPGGAIPQEPGAVARAINAPRILAVEKPAASVSVARAATRPIAESLEAADRPAIPAGMRSPPENVPTIDDLAGRPVAGSPAARKGGIGFFGKDRSPLSVLSSFGAGEVYDDVFDAQLNLGRSIVHRLDEAHDITRVMTPDTRARVFDWIDTGGDLGPNAGALSVNERLAAGRVKSLLDTYADRIDEVRRGLGKPPMDRRNDYITHLFEDAEDRRFEHVKLGPEEQKASQYLAYLKQRKGKTEGLIHDVGEALDAYIPAAERKIHWDPVLARHYEAWDATLETKQREYVKRYLNYVTGTPAPADAEIRDTARHLGLGRTQTKFLEDVAPFVQQRIYSGTLGYNVGTALQNLTQTVNTFAELGPRWTARGFKELFNPASEDLLVKIGVDESGITSAAEQRVRDALAGGRGAAKVAIDAVDRAGLALFRHIERKNRGIASLGAYFKAIAEGASPGTAIKYARDVMERTQFDYTKAGTQEHMRSWIAKIVFQFNRYPLGQAEFIRSLAGRAGGGDVMPLVRYIGAVSALDTAAFYGAGATVGGDPLSQYLATVDREKPFPANLLTGKPGFAVERSVMQTGFGVSPLQQAAGAGLAFLRGDEKGRPSTRLGSFAAQLILPGAIQIANAEAAIEELERRPFTGQSWDKLLRVGERVSGVPLSGGAAETTASPKREAALAFLSGFGSAEKTGIQARVAEKRDADKARDDARGAVADKAVRYREAAEAARASGDTRHYAELAGIYNRVVTDARAAKDTLGKPLFESDKDIAQSFDAARIRRTESPSRRQERGLSKSTRSSFAPVETR